MFSDFPNLHPLVVHFPIVLILLGAVFQALLVFKDWQQVRWVTLVILGAGFASALVASKVFHAHTAELPALANEIYQDHENYSAYTLWLSGITFLLRGIGEFYRIHRRSYESLVFASSLVAAVFLSLTGHRGAQLVYLQGVGPQGHLVLTDDHEHGGEQAHDHGGEQAHEGSPPEKGHQMPAAGKGANGHQQQHGPPRRQTQPGVAEQGETHPEHAPAHGTDHAAQPKQQHPGPHAAREGTSGKGTAGHDQHGAPQKPATSHTGMHHPAPAGKTKAKQAMARQDHSQMDHGNHKKTAAGHQAISHGTHPGKAPAAGQHPAMDLGAAPATGAHQQMGHTAGQGAKTDPYGRPLIDATQPYDNNPALEQARNRRPAP